MYSDRDSIREDIRKRLVGIKGIGPEKAERGSDAVMEYLDGLVQQSQGTPKEGERDEDGILVMKRPKGVPDRYHYLYWSPEKRETVWLNEYKVKDIYHNENTDHYSCGKHTDTESPLFLITSHEHMQQMLRDLPKCPVEDRIRRLVD